MNEKQFIFREFEISPTDDFINNLKLYEIDSKNPSSFDYSNYFVVYCDSEENVKSIVNKLNELTYENERLKAQLYCENEDGVCIICNNHYLVKGKTYDKYYISKCKKEHNECSTKILRYCKDFELKSD